MGNTSKIPSSYPGQVLKLTGIDEIDYFYMTQEPNIQRIEKARTEVDLRFTDFLRSLGSTKLWERCPNFQEVMRMMIVVIATNGKADINSMEWTDDPPYIKFECNVFSYKLRLLIEDYSEYIQTVNSFNEEIKDINETFDSATIKTRLKKIYKNVTDQLIDYQYSTEDMISCVQIVDKNDSVIRKSLTDMNKLCELSTTVKNDIKEVFSESRVPPRIDKIIQQATQAMFEGLKAPETIVNYFWPYPN